MADGREWESEGREMSDESSGETRRALIIGGSMAGLFSALLLRRRGWRVDVYERATDELASRGAGIATHPALVAALSTAGAHRQITWRCIDRRATCSIGFPVQSA